MNQPILAWKYLTHFVISNRSRFTVGLWGLQESIGSLDIIKKYRVSNRNFLFISYYSTELRNQDFRQNVVNFEREKPIHDKTRFYSIWRYDIFFFANKSTRNIVKTFTRKSRSPNLHFTFDDFRAAFVPDRIPDIHVPLGTVAEGVLVVAGQLISGSYLNRGQIYSAT